MRETSIELLPDVDDTTGQKQPTPDRETVYDYKHY